MRSMHQSSYAFGIKVGVPHELVHTSMCWQNQREPLDDQNLHQWSGTFLGPIGWDPSVCKSNWLHVDILLFSYIKLRYIS